MPHATSIRLDETALNRLDALAKTMGKSRSEAISEAVDNYLEYHEWFLAAVDEGIRQADAGKAIPFDDVIERFKARGLKID